jgi:hypothetical protein
MSILPTPNLMLINMTPGASAVAGNVWPANENTSRQMCDDALTGVMAMVATGETVTFNGGQPVNTPLGVIIPASVSGQSDQARQRLFEISGTLNADVTVLMPASVSRAFSFQNNCTGTVSGGTAQAAQVFVGVNNGAGQPAGNGVTLPRGQQTPLASDGTNVLLDSKTGMNLLQPIASATNTNPQSFNSASQANYLFINFTPVSAFSTIIIRATLEYAVQITSGANSNSAILIANIARGGSPLNPQIRLGGSGDVSGVSGVSLTPLGSAAMTWSESSPGTSQVTYAIVAGNGGTLGLTNTINRATLTVEEWL